MQRASLHAALGEPVRLAIVEDLVLSDRSPHELGERLGLGSNLLAHHLDTLESVGLIMRTSSSADARRKYVRLVHGVLKGVSLTVKEPRGEMLFVCTRNSARSQLASAIWTARTGTRASSAGTHPAPQIHPGAIAAAQRIGLSLKNAVPRSMQEIGPHQQVVTVCDSVHEHLTPDNDWWHWSIPDPVGLKKTSAFNAVVAELETRIDFVLQSTQHHQGK